MLSFTSIYSVLLVFLTRELRLTPAMVGVVFTAGNIGAVIGALAARAAGMRIRAGVLIIVSSLMRAVGVAVIPVTVDVGPFAVPVLVVGQFVHAAGWSLWAVHQGTTRQLEVPDELRGRVNGAFLFLVRGTTALGGFVGAGLAARLGVLATVTVGSIGAIAGTAWLLTPTLVHLRDLSASRTLRERD